jgi:manganese/zinc/iron transport system permease protein
MSLIVWTFVIALLTAVACSLAGVLLVVKREAFISEGLSHAVLPGIIFAFLIFQDRSSPWLILAAGLSGLLMVWLAQAICRSGRVYHDAALGIVFSGMFSVGIIASSMKLKNVHFHAHCIIDGNLAFAPIDRCEFAGLDWGPRAFVSMLFCLMGLLAFVVVFFKELKLMAFDESASHLLEFRPKLLHTIWVAIVSIVAVAAFETAGTILVVALMIAPAAAANLLTKRLSTMFVISGILGALTSALGVAISLPMSISPAGPIASMSGLVFLSVVLFAPTQGLVSKWRKRNRQRIELLKAVQQKRLKKVTTDRQ